MIKSVSILGVLAVVLFSNTAASCDPLYSASIGKHRSQKNIDRNEFRHPVETLNFFGIKDTMTVVEISPGGGWYTEILAPFLKDKGHYIAAGFDPASKSKYYATNAKKFTDKLAADPEHYGKAQVTVFQPPEKLKFTEDNSADMVVTFRNAHHWNRKGHAKDVFAAIYNAVKPGGIFGLVQHRAGHEFPKDTKGNKGYLKQSEVIKLVEAAGFKLEAKSEINANPKDTKDYKEGVWTLPPSYRLKDKDRAKYKAIGESDRMTLKFVKPASK